MPGEPQALAPADQRAFLHQAVSVLSKSKSSTKSKAKSKGKSQDGAKNKKRQRPAPRNSRGVEAVTVAWMLSILVTLLSGSVSIGMGLVLKFSETQWSDNFQVVPGLMLAVATITGLVTLLLTWMTNKLRRDPPPHAITWFASVCGCVPLLTIVTLTIMS